MVFIFFILGLVFGSFANVLIYRLPKNISIIFPFSFCPNCKAPIKWFDNIPLISYFLLSGKCRRCKVVISPLYPVVEFLTGIISVFCYLKFGIYFWFIFFNFFFVLLIVSFIDAQTTEIPDVLTYYLILSGLLFSFFNPLLGNKTFLRFINAILGGLVGFGLFFLIEFFGNKIFSKLVLGGGDIKLFCGIGIYLGVWSLPKIMFFACIGALIYAVLFSLLKRKNFFGQYIQFAPFISLGCLTYILLLN